MIILAAFRAVPRELYEAAEIDGAGAIRRFFNVTLPSIRNILGLLLMLTIVWSFKRFTVLWLLTGGGPGRATETMVIQIYRNAFKFFRENYASALGAVGLLIVVLITFFYFILMGRREQSGEF
jgi:multiple sugar transport system permease protein